MRIQDFLAKIVIDWLAKCMISPTYDIPFSLKIDFLSQFGLFVINSLSLPFKLSHVSLHTGIVASFRKRLYKSYNELYLTTEKFKFLVIDYDKERAAEIYEDVKKVLFTYRQSNVKLEKYDFVITPQIRLLNEKTLENLYEIEFLMRKKAFTDNEMPEDKILTEHAANLSLSSLQEP